MSLKNTTESQKVLEYFEKSDLPSIINSTKNITTNMNPIKYIPPAQVSNFITVYPQFSKEYFICILLLKGIYCYQNEYIKNLTRNENNEHTLYGLLNNDDPYKFLVFQQEKSNIILRLLQTYKNTQYNLEYVNELNKVAERDKVSVADLHKIHYYYEVHLGWFLDVAMNYEETRLMCDFNLYFDYAAGLLTLMNERNKPFYENLLLVQEWKVFHNFYMVCANIDLINYKLVISKCIQYNYLSLLNAFMTSNYDWYGAHELVMYFEAYGYLYKSHNVNADLKELLGNNQNVVNIKLLYYNVFKAIWEKIDDQMKKRLTDYKKFISWCEQNYTDEK